ncbi:CaiB/BaiF CoA-transferase family protein [Herbaspirillum sp. YR522]|uniref:CaiB/BaiF CoA transferase family protein n=1 Tax=Herbaspirillum sp. YR522 TaxID=1144342 RepID=UPI00026F760F|nr:CaiB/BaiF CoA-transferase family protein [Herbaspirillum sp. YR522]EJN09988.1 putative acyl-CoA transferase/carnitine dehydratase [Herbaspirillum sp. YR522]
MAGPLSHIKVLDLSRILAGPWSGQVLADLGADVIKVERPGVGDDTRSWGPPFLKDRDGNETREAGYYLACNRGKRSITVDLNSSDGQRIIRELAAQSDILLENYKVGTLAKFGLAYDDLKKINPGLIYCSVTGFGQTGPKADNAAYDFMIQAMGGLMSVTGERDDLPGGGPQKVGVPIVDLMTGMYTSVAVLAALARRSQSGLGDYIDIGMLDVMVGSIANQGMNYLISGKTPRRAGNKHPNIQPQDVFACADGYIVLVVGNDGQFAKFCQVIGHPEWTSDERFASNGNRVRHQAELLPMITEVLKTRGMQQWANLLDAAGVPCSPINTIPQVFEDEQVKHRGMLLDIAHPSAGSVPQIRSPMRFAQAALSFDKAPPLLGQHTDEVLAELGFDAQQISAWNSAGVI